MDACCYKNSIGITIYWVELLARIRVRNILNQKYKETIIGPDAHIFIYVKGFNILYIYDVCSLDDYGLLVVLFSCRIDLLL